MADDSLKKRLLETAAAVRREGFEEGYAAAVRDLLDAASVALPEEPIKDLLRSDAKPSRLPKTGTNAATSTEARLRDDFVPKIPREVAMGIAKNALQSIAPRAAGPTELLHIIKKNGGPTVPFTTLRRALDRLVVGGLVEEVGNTKTWRSVERQPNLSGNKINLRTVS